MDHYSNSTDVIRKHVARILSILMILSLLSGGIALTGAGGESAYSYAAGQTQGDFEYTVDGGSVTLTAYNGNDAEPAIPSSIDGLKVTAIGPECFRGNAKITTIKVPEGVTEIGDYAFEVCSGATSLTLPSTLETIGKGAFSGDAQIEEIVIPDKVRKIDDGAFLYCSKVSSLKAGKGLTELGQFVFAGCGMMGTADLSESKIEALPDRTFCNCESLRNVELPDSIETVGKRAFSRCSVLSKLEFGPNVKTVGDYVFERSSCLEDVSFEGSTGMKLGSNEFHNTDKTVPIHLRLPDNTVIADTSFSGAALGGIYVSGEGRLKSASGENLLIRNDQIYGDNGAALVIALPEKYDSGKDEWVVVSETVPDGSKSYTRYTVDPEVRRIAAGAFGGASFGVVVLPAGIETLDDKAFFGAEIKAVSISGDSSRYIVSDGILCEKAEAAENSEDKYRLLRFFPYKVENDALVRTTIKNPDADTEDSGPARQFELPDNIVSIAPYAFSNAGVHIEIADTSSLSKFEDYSFTKSGIRDPRVEEGYSFYGTIKVSEAILGNISIADTAFDDYDSYFPYDPDEEDDSDSQTIDDLIGDDTDEQDFNDRFARIRDDIRTDGEEGTPMPDGDDSSGEPDAAVRFTSESGNKSLYSDSKYSGYQVIPNSGFPAWSQKYLDYNKADIEFSQETMPYTMLYKGEAHYRSMVCVLNHDQYKTDYSIKNVGDDFAPMYLMMDHGLEAELQRGRVPDDIVLYSGITVERMADIAGITDKTVTPTKEQLINAIGREFTDPAFMSTTTNPRIAASFSSHSNTMIVIYASAEALSNLGAVVIDGFSGWGAGEYEILLNLGVKFKVLDVGTLEVDAGEDITEERTYIRLQMMDPKGGNNEEVKPAAAEPEVPVIHTAAKSGKKMRVYWDKVSGAVSYKLQYRKAGSSKWKTVKVKKTAKTLKKMKNGGLYQFRVAAVYSDNKTGKYSGTAYRYYRKTSGVKYRAKKAAVKVSWKKTKGASGYKILVSENKKLRNARVITVKGGKKRSATVKGLKSGKKYYFAVRPYKNKGGKGYTGIRSKIKRAKAR